MFFFFGRAKVFLGGEGFVHFAFAPQKLENVMAKFDGSKNGPDCCSFFLVSQKVYTSILLLCLYFSLS